MCRSFSSLKTKVGLSIMNAVVTCTIVRLYTAIYLVGRVAKQSVDPDYVGLGWVRQRYVTTCRKVTLETIVTLCSRSWPQHATRFDLILTTNLAAVVCVCAKFEHFLALRSYFESIRPENFVRIAKFQYAAFGPLFAFHCP